MTPSRRSNIGAALTGCLGLLAASCRNDAAATADREDPAAARGASPAPATAGRAAALPATSALAAPSAASTTMTAARDECGGPPSGSLPKLEERKLAAQQQGQYRFELKYPVFREDNEKVTQRLNRQLLDQLSEIKKRFVKEAEGQDHESDPDNARWFEGKCETAYHSASFVSVACDTMEGPGAHPNLDKFAYNFEICPEVRLLALADLCRSLPECRKKIVQLINEDFRSGEKKQTGIQFRDGPGVAHGEPSDPERPIATLRTFGITPTGMRFYLFDELPHVLQAFGIVDIPAAKLRAVLRDEQARRIWPS